MNIKRNIIFLPITVLLFFFGAHVVSAGPASPELLKKGNIDPAAVMLDGNEILFDVPPTQINDRLFVPARNILEALGYTVDWDEEKQMVFAENGNSTIEIEIGDGVVILDNCEFYSYLFDPPQIIEGNTFIPFYFFSNALDYQFLWDENRKTVYIESEFTGTQSIRPNQRTSLLDDDQILEEYENVPGVNILEDPEISGFQFSQIYKDHLYYFSEGSFLYRSNIFTGEAQQIISCPMKSSIVVDDSVYYQKSDGTNYLFRAALDGKNEALIINEPCEDYRVMDEKVYYIQAHTRNLCEYSIKTQEKKIIYDGFTNCFDISVDTHKVCYATAEYTDASTSLTLTGVYYYDTVSNIYKMIDDGKTIHADQLWCQGNALFYQTPPIDGCYTLYRYNLNHGYNIKLLDNLVDSLQVNKNCLLYYIKNNTPPPIRYRSRLDGTHDISMQTHSYQGITYEHMLKEVPDSQYFDEYLARDLGEYFISQGHVEYVLFRRTMMIGSTCDYPDYYAWITVTDPDGNIATEGAVCLNAYEKKGFAVTYFYTKEYILENPGRVGDVFPLFLQKKIFEFAKA